MVIVIEEGDGVGESLRSDLEISLILDSLREVVPEGTDTTGDGDVCKVFDDKPVEYDREGSG